MVRYITVRLVSMAVMILLSTLIVFLIATQVPADPVLAQLGDLQSADKELVASYRAKWGLDQPIWKQYLIFLRGLSQGDFGQSISTHRPVLEDIQQYAPATIELATVSFILAIAISIPLGVLAAVKRDTLIDHVARFISLIGVSAPTFWLAFIVLAASIVGLLTRTVRASMLEALSQDYVRVARAKGMRETAIVIRHALPNALVPVVTLGGIAYAILLTGAVMTETIFSWPGLGRYTFRSAIALDFPGIMGITFIVAVVYLFVNLIVDLSYALIDPRVVRR